MAATVTIDKAYFETLLRRAEIVSHLCEANRIGCSKEAYLSIQRTSGRDLITPVDIPIVSIPKIDHDNLLRMAQEYTSLKDSLYKGGIEPETLEILIRGEAVPISQVDTFIDDGDEPASAGVDLYNAPQKTRITMSRPFGQSWADSEPEWPPKNSAGSNVKWRGGFYDHHNSSALEDESNLTPDLEKDDPYLAAPQPERKRLAKTEQRTVFAKNLSDRTCHKDIVDFVRGGMVLDIYLRERSVSISFVEGSAAQEFMKYVKRKDIYVHGKRLEFSWSERQFILPRHVRNMIGIGATRNVIIRGIDPFITEEIIREQLDHIHNIVVISVSFENGDASISFNSINNSLYARTCMMSRVTYKGMKIEWFPDECAQPLPEMEYAPKKGLAPQQPKTFTSAMNRFQMLNIDTEDHSETDEEPTVLSDLSSSEHQQPRSPWNPRMVA